MESGRRTCHISPMATRTYTVKVTENCRNSGYRWHVVASDGAHTELSSGTYKTAQEADKAGLDRAKELAAKGYTAR